MQDVIQIGNLWGYDTKFKNKTTGRVYDKEGVSPTLNTMTGGWKQPMIIDDTQGFEDEPRVYDGVAPTLRSQRRGLKTINGYHIRKLTPLECWRLMDFSDEDFRKAEAVNSNTQLYKQAGNSIVKSCLVAIFGQMIEGKEDFYKEVIK